MVHGTSNLHDCKIESGKYGIADEDASYSNSCDTTSINTGAHTESGESGVDKTIAHAENQAVFRIRLLVIIILVSLTVGVACMVFFFTHRDEVEAFETAFIDDTEKIFESIGTTLDASLGAVDSYSVSLVSYAKASNSTWPLVAVPDFASRIAKIRTLSKSFLIGQFQVVQEEDRREWEAFTFENSGWVNEALKVQRKDPTFEGVIVEDFTISPVIYNNVGVAPNNTGPYYPTWQQYPTVPLNNYPPYNWDGSSSPRLINEFAHMENHHEVVMGMIPNIASPHTNVDSSNAWVKSFFSGTDSDHTEPFVDIFYPVFDGDTGLFPSEGIDGGDSKMVSVLSLSFYWRNLLENILPPGSDGTVVVVENACGQSFTYQINGPQAIYLGPEDLHDTQYEDLEQTAKFSELKDYHKSEKLEYTGFPLAETLCPYTVRTYPSQVTEDHFLTSKPAVYTTTSVAIFLLTSAVFLLYDSLVERRQKKIMQSAAQTNAIVSSLFPSNVRKRLYDMEAFENSLSSQSQKTALSTWLTDGKDKDTQMSSKEGDHNKGRPIADLFPDTTVLFADIAGFTAWSSIREPSQVFILLENVYGAFDAIAKRRRVFKVETIGDSYVAVAGLPEPRSDHAVIMAKFAHDCRGKIHEVTRELAVTLGPDTDDLAMRFGLHSGPVTAGVLRGQKSRFQLFGDTVNTAARMESTGARHKIQVSQATADQLIQAGKEHWITPREETVEAKGKGMMQTYWVTPKTSVARPALARRASTDSGSTKANNGVSPSRKLKRLIEWNVDVLSRLICQIIQRRFAKAISGLKTTQQTPILSPVNADINAAKRPTTTTTNEYYASGSNVLGEVKEIIELPDYDRFGGILPGDVKPIVLTPTVKSQLQEFVVAIATSYEYEQNSFHNFEHASHVAMSVAKLLHRIVGIDDDAYGGSPTKGEHVSTIESTEFERTFGINSDPLTMFACVFSALIHDAGHPGVPNSQLIKEKTSLAEKYKNRSIAEQNSVDVAWSLFMDDMFSDLRGAICPTGSELKRFRQLVVNSVMATDIMDTDSKRFRNSRWEKAFSKNVDKEEPKRVSRNRKATIVIEHLIQASDVAHTMQHWHIYCKWNERLFEEMYCAYKEGRSDRDPSEFWYRGEMDFFDSYILPLAKRLSECGVFGVSSDEYLNYASKNREEWERKGEEVVAKMVQRLSGSARA